MFQGQEEKQNHKTKNQRLPRRRREKPKLESSRKARNTAMIAMQINKRMPRTT